ncbi:MAG: bacteriorhodopsin [Planctomycetota bacterium]
MENFIVFSPWANFIIAHVLSLGAAAMFAGLVYFIVTAKQISPKYRVANWLGAVVMVSAALELGNQYIVWKSSIVPFTGADGATLFAVGENSSRFSNGYRYVNWSIDVPVLLAQFVVVFGLMGKKFWSPVIQFTIAGLLMIYFGYIGQFFEAVPEAGTQIAAGASSVGGDLLASNVGQNATYWLMFVVSCVFYLWILYLVLAVGLNKDNLAKLPPKAQAWMKAVVWTLFGSWMLYLVGYLMPAVSISEESAVIRQMAYTIADIVSKVLYGIMLGYVAVLRSNAEGYNEDRLDRIGYDQGGKQLGQYDPTTEATA